MVPTYSPRSIWDIVLDKLRVRRMYDYACHKPFTAFCRGSGTYLTLECSRVPGHSGPHQWVEGEKWLKTRHYPTWISESPVARPLYDVQIPGDFTEQTEIYEQIVDLSDQCGAYFLGGNGIGWWCTRLRGHTGPHQWPGGELAVRDGFFPRKREKPGDYTGYKLCKAGDPLVI